MSPGTCTIGSSWKQLVLFAAMLVLPGLLFLVITMVDNLSLRQEQCPVGYFPCGNLTMCVPQIKQCDDVQDCPNGEDETYDHCLDKTALNRGAHKVIPLVIPNMNCNEDDLECMLRSLQKNNNTNGCDLKFSPQQCKCYYSKRIKCDVPLSKFPSDIPSEVTDLLLQNTGIVSLPDDMSRFTELKKLQLTDNYITDISNWTFQHVRKLKSLYLQNNQLTVLRNNSLSGLTNLHWLFLEGNRIAHIETDVFSPCKSLLVLKLSRNLLSLTAPYYLHLPSNILLLDLDSNHITTLTPQSIQNAQRLEFLYLQNNSINNIKRGSFGSMMQLRELNLSCNSIHTFEKEMFSKTNALHTMSMSQNPVTTLKEDAFFYLRNLSTLNITGITINNISPMMFQRLTKLRFIYFEKFDYCTFIPMVRVCEPRGDGISSLNNLLDLPLFRICIWVVAFFTCSGNIFVMVLRLILRDEKNIHSLFIKNLCAADFTMGLYLLVVASHDIMFRDQYNKHAQAWMSSWCCQATGFLAMTSCEVSILLVTFMSVERCIRISFPYKAYTFNTKRAVISLFCIWTIGILLAAIPMFSKRRFGTFYGSNGVCFPLHIHDPFLSGWQYSFFVFVGVNFVAMIMVSLCYIIMFISIRNSQKKTRTGINKDISFAKRFFLIVLTDAMCWIPIIVIKVLAFANISISDQFYAWLTIFVLPINSAINPIVYSVTTTTFRRKFQETFLQKSKTTGPSTLTTASCRTKSQRSFLQRNHVIQPGMINDLKKEEARSPLIGVKGVNGYFGNHSICPVNTVVKISNDSNTTVMTGGDTNL